MDTSRQMTWPPLPTISDPLAAHDAFLTALVCAPATKPTLSRLWMVQALRKETGLDSRRCIVVVNGYCERQGIFPLRRGLMAWLHLMLLLLPGALFVGYRIGMDTFTRQEAAARTARAMLLILDKSIAWGKFFLCALCLSVIAYIVDLLIYSKRIRHEAEEARRRVGSGLGGA